MPHLTKEVKGHSGLVCGQLLQILENTSGSSKEPLKPSAADDTSQVLLGDGSGMSGVPQMPSVPGQLDDSGMSPHSSRPPMRFFCPVCPKGFRSKLDVERHLRTHTGEKPFQCPYCPHRSATKGNLKAHMRHIHMDVRLPF
ncbi:zinc finger protein 219-like [Penaeus monodon]|uniref:zinc finger protein 219-like n=1 Tax=Penaeus monodon TaxID=6687 RepID=UPI0018A7BB81|nr:zinc finger protein 219-like [Penaeus monodon]